MNLRTATSGLVWSMMVAMQVSTLHAEITTQDISSDKALTFTLSAKTTYAQPTGVHPGRVVGIPGPADMKVDRVSSIPTFTRSIVARGRTYRFTMVGSDPFVRSARKVVVPMQIIPVRFEFDDGTFFDPSLPSPACAGGGSAVSRVLNSPVVKSANYGDGNRQFEEEVRRLEFWTLTGARGGRNPNYSVRVSASVLPTLNITVNGFPTVPTPCGRVGLLDLQTWDDFIKSEIFPGLAALGVSPRTFPLFLFLNVELFIDEPDNCCVLGYHSAFNSGGTQTYGIADYDVSQSDPHTRDVSVLSHELGEWYDDPFVNNATPAWGHIGQVPGCQANLEVGDPSSGSLHSVRMPDGFTYHPQELAFFSWFFNQSPSLGINGWYSSGGTLRHPAPLCQ